MSTAGRRRGRSGDGPKRVADSMERVLARLGASPSPQVMELVFTRWDEVVGGELGAHVRPQRLEGATLVVGADHPAWATRARMESGRILARLCELGDETLTRIEVVIARS